MRTDFTSIQSVEINGPNDTFNESEFEIGLECTASYSPGYFNPAYGGEPPSGPEFELTTITVYVPKVNYKGEITEYEKPLSLSYNQFCAILGRDVADTLIDKAMDEAAESGEF